MSNNEYYNDTVDFVIPLHRYHYMVRTVVEAIHHFYSPRTIYIVTPKPDAEIVKQNAIYWEGGRTVKVFEEETFFMKNHGLHYRDIYDWFNQKKDERSREFGWWYQQLIKLGASTQIEGLSSTYIVWDSDLIPLKKWEIYPADIYRPSQFKFAILQETSRTLWNTEQYTQSLFDLTGLPICDPPTGTFVPHHFVFHKRVLADLISMIESKSAAKPPTTKPCWIKSVMDLSHKYFRFSEYRMVASFMMNRYPELLNYHSFEDFGKFGERIREPVPFLEKMENFFGGFSGIQTEGSPFLGGISYNHFVGFVEKMYSEMPSYLQLEHI